MASTVANTTQQKFSNLRKRLDQLGYQQPLGIESLPLVERLFVDLVHTTESLKKAKLEIGSVNRVTEKTGIPSQVDAYKSDNAKLLKENNDLHQKLIKQTEEMDYSIKDLKDSLRKIEHENADLRFLNNQYVHKMRTIEKESKQKSERIVQLQEKNFHAVVQTPGGRKKNIPFRRQRMEVDSTLPPQSETSYHSARTQADDPYIADMLKVADENIGKLNKDKCILQEEKEGLENKIHSFRKQVETRESEIDRLTRLLEGGRPYDVVALETRNRSNERLISHLNIQIDYLQQKNAELQRQVDDIGTRARFSTDKSLDLDSRNQTLERELADVDVMAQQMQLDKDVAIRAADREVADAKLELQKSRTELETMDVEVARLKAEKERLMNDLDNVRGEFSGLKNDKLELGDLLDKVQEDKRRLGVRINKLTANEKDLVIEIDRLKHRNGTVKGKRSKSAGPVEVFVKGLEEERDYWKGEVDVLQKLLRSKTRPGSPSPGVRSRGRSRSLSPSRSLSLSVTPKKKSRSRPSSPGGSLSKSGSNTHYEAIIKVLEEERDHYKRETDLLKAIRSRPSSPMSRSRSPARDKSMSLAEETELVRVQRERDELQVLLDKFERHMAEIQANVQVLTSERDNLNGMYGETKEELNRLRREVVRSPKSPKTSLAAQAVLRRVENERDDAMAELRKLSTERDTLRERLKIATETQLADRARMEQRTEDLDNSLRNTEIERSRLEERTLTLQKLVDSLEDQVTTTSRQLADARDEASAQLAAADQMRILAEQAERSLTDSRTVLTRREGELRHLDDKSTRLEDEISVLQRMCRVDQDEISKLKTSIAALDREKDNLQMEVDEKAERLEQFNEELTVKEKVIADQRLNVNDLEVTLSRAQDFQGSKEREVGSLRRQLDSTNEELTEVGRGREVALRENRRLQEDLTTMTRENQRLHEDLDGAVEDRELLRTQIQDYVVEVKRCEELLSSKEGERSDLLEQYRSLSLEAERYETQTHQLESEGSSLRLELMTRESEIRRLHEKIGLMERDLHERHGTERSYEVQFSSLTNSVAHLEDTVRQLEDEKHSILRDLSAVRDLCSQLEASKDALQRQLTNKQIDQDKLGNLLEDMKQETDMLRSQVTSERSSVKSLEEMLAANRHKEFEAQMSVQEKTSDAQLLKDRLALSESKIESLSRELSTGRSRNMELESDVDRMRRQLTSERFERERAVQELRRNGLPVPGENRSSRISSPITPSSVTRSRSPASLRARSPARSRSPYRNSTMDDDPLTSTHTA